MLTALRAVAGTLFFLGVFFYPFQFTVLSQLFGHHSWQESNQQTSELTAVSSPTVTGRQPAKTKHPQADDKGKSPQISQPEKMLPLPQQPMAVEPPPEGYPQIVKRVEVKGKVGLSFDDGPFPGMTEQYLDVLEKYDTRATFFMIGQQVNLYPGLARKVVEQGSEIGSHTWRHDRLDQLETEQIFANLQSVAEYVYDTVGKEISLLRPPYGRHSEAVVTVAQELNQQLILWDVDPRDWEDPPPNEIVAKIMDQTKPGSIIVLHEGHKNTLQALPEIIQKLRERDLEPVPISELFN